MISFFSANEGQIDLLDFFIFFFFYNSLQWQQVETNLCLQSNNAFTRSEMCIDLHWPFQNKIRFNTTQYLNTALKAQLLNVAFLTQNKVINVSNRTSQPAQAYKIQCDTLHVETHSVR